MSSHMSSITWTTTRSVGENDETYTFSSASCASGAATETKKLDFYNSSVENATFFSILSFGKYT